MAINFENIEVKKITLRQTVFCTALAKAIKRSYNKRKKEDPDSFLFDDEKEKEKTKEGSRKEFFKMLYEEIINEYDMVNNSYGEYGKQVFRVLEDLTGIRSNLLEDITLEEFVKLFQVITEKQEGDWLNSFLEKSPMT